MYIGMDIHHPDMWGTGPAGANPPGGLGLALTAAQLRRALVVLLREGESVCSRAAFDLGADRCADEDLNDLAAGLDWMAGVVRGYRHLRAELADAPETGAEWGGGS